MSGSYAAYPLDFEKGTIDHWLAAGVLTTPLAHMADHVREEGSPFGERGRWAMNFWAFDPEVADLKLRAYRALPEQPASLSLPADPILGGSAPGGAVWRSAQTEEDGVIDFSRFNFNPTLMEGWLYALVESDEAQTVEAVLSTIGPARLWLNGELVAHFAERFSYVALQRIRVTLALRQGLNAIALHGEMLGWREARLALGLELKRASLAPLSYGEGAGGEVSLARGEVSLARGEVSLARGEVSLTGGEVSVTGGEVSVTGGEVSLARGEVSLARGEVSPAKGEVSPAQGEVSGLRLMLPIGDLDPGAWHEAETALDSVGVRSFAFPNLPGSVWLNPGLTDPVTVDAEVRIPVPDTPWAKLIGLTLPKGTARLTLEPGKSAPLPITPELAEAFAHLPGENTLLLTLRPVNGIPLERHYEIWASANEYSSEPYGTYDSRIQEARQHLAAMPYDVPASMAAVATGRAAQIDSNAVAVACAFLNDRADCADFYAIGLLAALYWYGESPALKPEDQAKIEAALRGFKFWIDEPGIDAMCYFTENHQVLFHVTGYLTGQRFPDWTFANSGLTGREQRAKAIPKIESWIKRRLRGDFSEWDSNAYLTLDAFAMLALVEFSEDAHLVDLASALLDKIFFSLAVKTYRGTLGTTHGRCYTVGLKSARVENTSPLCRIAFGMGIFNGETRATGLLALARQYRVPDLIQKIGADVGATVTTHSRAYGELVPESDMKAGVWDVRTITHRTPYGSLSAAVDHRPGTMGIQEHLWQATLSPEAVVFTTYPGNAQEHGNARPNFWAGSVRLPRVAMIGRDLICLYRIEPGVGMGFTHAYFPTEAFDEWEVVSRWALARVGDGYVALWGDGDLRLTQRGSHAYQEIRSSGAGQVWICRLGNRATDGSFQDFRRSQLASYPVPHPHDIGVTSGVTWTPTNGETLDFGWESLLTVNGTPQDWEHFPHYADAYTHTPHGADQMVIAYGGESLTLNLITGRTG